MHKLFISLAKGKSEAAKNRSLMLKEIMPKLSGPRGERLALAFKNKDKKEIRAILLDITQELSS